MSSEIQYIANKLNKKWVTGFKQLGNNPSALTKSIYINKVLPDIDRYFITDKADGLRAFLLINSQNIKYIISTNIIYMQIENSFNSEYIFDCELINDVLYIFDVIVYNDTNVSLENFNERYQKILEFQRIVSDKGLTNFIKVKTFYKLEFKSYQQQIMDLYKYKTKKLQYTVDGLIFIESTHNYNMTTNLKWKPPELLTIDFLALRSEESTGSKYILTNGIKASMAIQFGLLPNSRFKELIKTLSFHQNIKEDYIPVPFYNSLRPNIFLTHEFMSKEDLHGHIIELSLDLNAKNNKWVFHRIRHDRDVELKNGSYYGNNYKVAETTLQSILNPLSLKELVMPFNTLVKDLYFKKQDSSYKSVKKFNNYIKNLLIRRYKGSNVLDLASGRGGDLKKYVDVGVKNLLMLEIDNDAIDEVINRKYTILTKSENGCNMTILQSNLNDDYKKNIKIIEDNFVGASEYLDNTSSPSSGSFPAIFCHFAMHYLFSNEKTAKNIASFISHYLAKGGSFVITIFDGQRVFNLLKQHKGKWAPNKKYMISYASYVSNSSGKQSSIFAGFGHKINVLLPLADKPYEEPLIDLFALDKIFKPHGIQRVEDRNFGDMLDEYKKNSHDQIFDEHDSQFIKLYKYVVYTKS